MVAAEAAAERGDVAEAVAGYLEAARTFEEAGLIIAALDACREALALAPGDIDTHLRYASICRTRGWRELAHSRMTSVLRLAELQGDDAGRARVRAEIEASYTDDEELMRLSA
jgi:Tfp pilus assembly protein PilF